MTAGRPINSQWLTENSARAYPLTDNATQRDRFGAVFPTNLLVDCRITAPDDGTYDTIYLSSFTVTAALVTATFSASRMTLPELGDTPLGAVQVVRPITPFRMYPVQPLLPGVGGWVAFGHGIILELADFRFDDPAQSLLVQEASRLYRRPGVTSLGVANALEFLQGLVRLQAIGDIRIQVADRKIDGVYRKAIVFSLSDQLDLESMKRYIGPCLGRPEGRTCGNKPIYEVSGVRPDCFGNIELEFVFAENLPITVTPITGGLVFSPQVGLDTVCADRTPLSDLMIPSGNDFPAQPPLSLPAEFFLPNVFPAVPLPYSHLQDFDSGTPTEFRLIDNVQLSADYLQADMELLDCQWQVMLDDEETPMPDEYYQYLSMQRLDLGGGAAPNGVLEFFRRPIRLVVNFAELPETWSEEHTSRFVGLALSPGLLFGVRTLSHCGDVRICLLRFDGSTYQVLNSDTVSLPLAGNSNAYLVFYFYGYKIGSNTNVTLSLSVNGVAADGTAVAHSYQRNFTLNSFLSFVQSVNNWLAVACLGWDYADSYGANLPNYPVVLDNFSLDFTGSPPPAIPCLGRAESYGSYGEGAERASCIPCNSYVLRFPEGNTVCGLYLPFAMNTYSGGGSLFSAYGQRAGTTTNVGILATPDGCEGEIYLMASNGTDTLYAVGQGFLPDPGKLTYVTLIPQTLCGTPFLMEIKGFA